MSAPLLKEHVVPLTVDQYHRMIELGILPEGEPIELLDGYLIRKDRSKAGADPMTVGNHHAWAVSQLMTVLLPPSATLAFTVRIQQPVTIPPEHEPEPDAVLARRDPENFKHGHPKPADIFCVIEVADSSLQRDRTTKYRIYAEAGVPQYVIVNLVDGVIEDYGDPAPDAGRYTSPRTYRRGDAITFRLGDGQAIAVQASDLLP